MLRLIQFEFKKAYSSTFFRIMLATFFLFIVVYYMFVYINTIRAEDMVAELKRNIFPLQQQVEELYDSIDSNIAEADREVKNEIELSENYLAHEEVAIKAYAEKDWTTILEREIEDVEHEINNLVYRNEYYSPAWPTLFTRETLMEQNKWLRDKKIVPLLPLDELSWLTVYDLDFRAVGDPDGLVKEIVESRSAKYSSSGIHYLMHLFGLLFGVYGIGFFLFLFGDILTKEGLGRNGSIHLLRTQPIQKDKIIVSKIITVLVLSFLILFGAVGISLLLGTAFDRFGDWNYPVLVYGEAYAFEFINMSTFLFKSMLLFFMVLLFGYSLLFLFSVLTKRMIVALGLTLSMILIGINFGEEVNLTDSAQYIPFHYFSTPQIITMELAVTLNNFGLTFLNGVIVLGASSIIIFFVTYILSLFQ